MHEVNLSQGQCAFAEVWGQSAAAAAPGHRHIEIWTPGLWVFY